MTAPDFELRLAQSDADLIAAQRLRYDVFVRELGGNGSLVDHERGLERDAFDPFYDHLILFDNAREGSPAVGVYRLLRGDKLKTPGGPDHFYSEAEYDLSILKASGRKLLELGRSCLHPDYRGGAAMMHLWTGLAAYVEQHKIEILFGVASFHGTDVEALKASLSVLHHRHLAPASIRVRAQPDAFQPMDLLPESQIDRPAAMRAVPALIKGYLRLGGFVGEGAFVDHAFNTTDICLIIDMAQVNDRARAIYAGGAA
ncbi:ornithine-acyl[acyl carrier protein] N-acyltransferase [Aliiroseovarius halocynthiae]|uniref:L-ornithine N(alpha)-acyltransferase n=1 Tax=Aliiroseovarius halocynthiae TaxID=985055 RepID=A0A545SW02_9RHOB|nr:GNAT family N-acyltransferase [Aliiroseovarius halocynthiae]TQV69143.1 GNAT family N-acetyltransferase [Aliiroseovarius halocynthiae]SMR71900.1 ornithine-acyl[acyl carrier protein] N-acyltransferase [Aliiroseovarius halocynthiae]